MAKKEKIIKQKQKTNKLYELIGEKMVKENFFHF